MANIRHRNGRFQVQVRRVGFYRTPSGRRKYGRYNASATFLDLKTAEEWALLREKDADRKLRFSPMEMAMLKIECGVPIPPRQYNEGAPAIYPFETMNETDCFWMEKRWEHDTLEILTLRAGSAVQRWREKHPEQHFAIREIYGRVGVWRVKDNQPV